MPEQTVKVDEKKETYNASKTLILDCGELPDLLKDNSEVICGINQKKLIFNISLNYNTATERDGNVEKRIDDRIDTLKRFLSNISVKSVKMQSTKIEDR